MRITRTLLNAVSLAILRDIPPGRDFDGEAATLVRTVAMKRVPKELHEWIRKRPDLFNTTHVWTPGSLSTIAVVGSSDGNRHDLVESDPNLKLKLEELSRLKSEQNEQTTALLNRVRNSLAAFTTVKQAKEALPEFAKYFPDDSAKSSVNLPAVRDTVAALKQAGWPAGKGKPQ